MKRRINWFLMKLGVRKRGLIPPVTPVWLLTIFNGILISSKYIWVDAETWDDMLYYTGG